MTCKVFVAAFSLGSLAASAQNIVPGFDASRVTFSQAGNMDMGTGNGDLDVTRFELRSFLCRPISPIDGLFIMPLAEYRLTALNFDQTPATYPIGDEDLHSLSLSTFAISMREGSPWIYGGWARAELASDFQEIDGDDFTFDLAGGAGYRFNEKFTLGFGGAAINLNGDNKIYPGIGFDLNLTPNHADLMGDPVDVAIRMGPPKDQNLIARPIARLEMVLLASPDYLRKRGTPSRPQDLLAHDCLRMKDAPWALIHRDGSSQTVDASGQFIANNRGLLHQLALNGQGIVQASSDWAKADLEAGRLVHILQEWAPPVVQAYALTTTRLLPAKVRVFLDFLLENMAQPAGQ